jgi:RNA recognition motif-containing protein
MGISLSIEATDDKLRDLFSQYGTVELVNIPRDRATGDPRGFAFVDMATPDEVETAISALDGYTVDSRSIRVSKSMPKAEVEKLSPASYQRNSPVEGATKLYVGNIPFGTIINCVSPVQNATCAYAFPFYTLVFFRTKKRRWRKLLPTTKRLGRCWRPTFQRIGPRERAEGLLS